MTNEDGRAMGKIARLIALLAALPLIGAGGFVLVEGWSFFDALYMAVITLTTVGFREVHELSAAGRVFTMVFLVTALGVFFYGVVQLGELVVRAELSDWLRRRRMHAALKSMKDHMIVCGFGRMGRVLCRHLAAKGLCFVALDRDEAALADCRDNGWPWLVGDATDDASLVAAGIERARGLAAVLADDSDNVYVVLSARLLNRNLQILARASDEKSVSKLQKAGADRVVSLYEASATKMAQLLASPNLEDFMEIFTGGGSELDLAEIRVTPGSPYAGTALDKTDFRERGVIVVGIRRGDGELILPPPSSMTIEPEDSLIAVGKARAIAELVERV